MAPHSSVLPGEFQGQRSQATVHRDHKESDMSEWLTPPPIPLQHGKKIFQLKKKSKKYAYLNVLLPSSLPSNPITSLYRGEWGVQVLRRRLVRAEYHFHLRENALAEQAGAWWARTWRCLCIWTFLSISWLCLLNTGIMCGRCSHMGWHWICTHPHWGQVGFYPHGINCWAVIWLDKCNPPTPPWANQWLRGGKLQLTNDKTTCPTLRIALPS